MTPRFLPLALLLLTGCGPKEGRVVSRAYYPAHDDEINYFITVNTGTTEILIPETETIHHVPYWTITVTLDNTNFGTWSCSFQDYNNATNGAWFRKGHGIVPKPNIEK